jgi:prolipoprotein diacylglyceryltransferase
MNVFSILIALGTVLGLSWAVIDMKEKGAVRMIDACLGFLLICLAVGRVAFIAVHWDYYRGHPLEIPRVWDGGLSAPGALFGGLLVLFIFRIWKSLDLALFVDRFLPLFMLITVAAWLGSWIEGIGYGPLSGGSLFGLPSRDEWGSYAKRFPIQLIGAVLTLGWFWFLDSQQKRKKLASGLWTSWGFLGICMIFTGLTFLRADPALYWYGLRLDTWGGLGLIGLLIIFLILDWRLKQS